MKTALKIHGNGLRAGFYALMGALILSLWACNSDNPTSPGGSNSAITGRVEGNGAVSKISADSLQGVVVTAFAINADGSRGAQMAQDTTDAQGNFLLTTAAQGGQNWLLVAVQGNMQWMSRYNDTLTRGKTDTARPLNFESTLQTQVYLSLQGSDSGRQVRSSEITAAVDVNVAVSYRSQYESGDSASRLLLASQLAAVVRAQSQARAAYLSLSNASTYASDTAGESGSTRKAEANLNFALYNAYGDSAQTRQAESAYLQAMVSAYAGSDSGSMSSSRANEAAYQATLMATVSFSDSTRNVLRRRALHVMAVSSDTAMLREFNRAGASQSQWQAVATASASFQSAVDTSRTDASRDSASARYRAAVQAVFQSQDANSDSAFIALNLLLTVSLSTAMHSLSGTLQTQLAADAGGGDASGMGRDMENRNTDAMAQIMAQWQGNSHAGTADRNSAMTQIAAFLWVSSNSSHNGT